MEKDYIYISGIQYDNTVSGDYFRNVCYISGCWWNCYLCHNPETHNPEYGKKYNLHELAEELCKDDNEITLSGGDNLTYQLDSTLELVKILKIKYKKNIWLYTGFEYEEILNDKNPKRREVLNYIDVLVDGRFDYLKADSNLAFKGSFNQRIIDVPSSLKEEIVILWEA